MSSGQQAPTPYQPPNQAGAAAGFQQGTQALQQGGQAVQQIALPGYQQLLQQFQNNPYFSTAMGGAQNVAAQGGGIGQSDIAAGQQLQTLSGQLGQYAPGMAATAFDPQNALYNRTQQQVTDQAAAINAMNGVSGSPYGAGLATQANTNFNLDWQNQQQGRQLAGTQGLEGLAGAQGALSTTGAALKDQGLNTMISSSAAPDAVFQQQKMAEMAALNALVQGDTASFGLTQESIGDQGTYLGIGQAATTGAQEAAKINNAQANAMWQGIGTMLGDVAGMFKFTMPIG